MNLKSLNQDLNRIVPNRQPTVEHILQAINSLCTDIQYHCGEDCDIYSGPVQNYRVLNNCLTRLASMLCDIYDAHSEDIRRETRVSFPDRIRTVEKETRENERFLQEQESRRGELNQADLLEEKRLLEEQKAGQQAVIKQLQMDLADAADEEARLSTLAAAAAAKKQTLDGKIAAHNQLLTQLADADTQIQNANADLQDAQTKLEAAAQNRNQLLTRIRETNTAAAALQQESATLTGQLATANTLRQERQRERDALSLDLSGVNDQIAQLKEQSIALRTELEQRRSAVTNANGEISRLESDIHTVQEARTALTDQVFTLTAELDYQKQQNEAIRTGELQDAETALAEARKRLQELTVQCDALKEAQQSLNEKRRLVDADIRRYNSLTKAQKDALEDSTQKLEAARQAYEAKEAELNEIDRKIRLLGEDLAPIQEKIAEAQALYDSYNIVELKAMYGRTHDELLEKTAAAKQLQEALKTDAADLDTIRRKYEELLGQKSHIEQEFHRVNAELSGLQDPGVQAELRKLQANTEVLNHIRAKVLVASRDLHIADADIPAVLKNDLSEIDRTLMKLRGAITDYTRHLEKSISGN